ncbi:nucleoside-binding protein [Microlunatus sagamiharensis]|uniref:Nucleoside-binding protein n=1 Tax=Microlunatus sagamiharensis TaxID=546874 RepID=A0A1H2LJ90_9ACTN|nr:BMP family ABC transporter substrate-binding protein [Microlunatus sagamiharensis]SDU80698.1 nucleoside-binding protein [Microlunatus sagamiharensis]
MKKTLTLVGALATSAALALAGCAQAPGTDAGSSAPASGGASSAAADSSGFKACMVSDSGGFDDKSFNQTAYKGLTDAKTELGIETGQVESNAAADYAKNVQSMVDAKCSIIVTVGFALSDDTLASAKANPSIKYAIVDNNDPENYPAAKNLKPLVFNTAQSSFLAGYVAAGMSQTGKVGTFGGQKFPTVTIFMDGFAQGVEYYNKQKSKSVSVLGWDEAKQDGQFVGSFEDQKGGQRVAQGLVSQGADIILPVAGPAGLGALQAAKASGGKVNAIWVDTDGCVSAETYCSNIITSVTKGLDVSVTDAIKAAKDGSFDNSPYVGTLENGGTGLAPYHDFDGKVPAELKSEVDALKADIISGKITIESKSQPTS